MLLTVFPPQTGSNNTDLAPRRAPLPRTSFNQIENRPPPSSRDKHIAPSSSSFSAIVCAILIMVFTWLWKLVPLGAVPQAPPAPALIKYLFLAQFSENYEEKLSKQLLDIS